MNEPVTMTRHGRIRAKARGFSNELISLIQDHGAWDGDRQVLSSSDVRTYLKKIDALRSLFVRLLDKGGGTVALTEDGRVITVFSPRTYRRTHRSRRALMAEV